jgi:hypothetical protein
MITPVTAATTARRSSLSAPMISSFCTASKNIQPRPWISPPAAWCPPITTSWAGPGRPGRRRLSCSADWRENRLAKDRHYRMLRLKSDLNFQRVFWSESSLRKVDSGLPLNSPSPDLFSRRKPPCEGSALPGSSPEIGSPDQAACFVWAVSNLPCRQPAGRAG